MSTALEFIYAFLNSFDKYAYIYVDIYLWA